MTVPCDTWTKEREAFSVRCQVGFVEPASTQCIAPCCTDDDSCCKVNLSMSRATPVHLCIERVVGKQENKRRTRSFVGRADGTISKYPNRCFDPWSAIYPEIRSASSSILTVGWMYPRRIVYDNPLCYLAMWGLILKNAFYCVVATW